MINLSEMWSSFHKKNKRKRKTETIVREKPLAECVPPEYLINLPPEVIVRLLRTIILQPQSEESKKDVFKISLGESAQTLDLFLSIFPTFKRYVILLTDRKDIPKMVRSFKISGPPNRRTNYVDLLCIEGIQKFTLDEMNICKWRKIQKMTVLPLFYIAHSEWFAGTWMLAGLSSRSLYRLYMGPNTVVLISLRKAYGNCFICHGVEMLERLAKNMNVPLVDCFGGLQLSTRTSSVLNRWLKDGEKYILSIPHSSTYITNHYWPYFDDWYAFYSPRARNDSSFRGLDFKLRIPRQCQTPPPEHFEALGCSTIFIAVPSHQLETVYIEYDTARAPWIHSGNFPYKSIFTALSLLNTNWSFDNPFGWCCEHAYALGDYIDQAHWSYYDPLPSERSLQSMIFTSVVYVGLPDMTVARASSWSSTEFFYWKRLVPNLNSAKFSPHISEVVECPKLKGIKLFDKIFQQEINNQRPLFYAPLLERLVLVSLDGSDTSFDLRDVLYKVEDHKNLHDLYIVSTGSPSSAVPIFWDSLSPIKGLVRRLVVAGLYPSFVVDNSPNRFSCLRDLSIDLTPLCTLDSFGKQIAKTTISLDFSRAFGFPCLERLYLMMISQYDADFTIDQGVFAANVNIELMVPSSLNVLDISTVLYISYQPGISLNGQKIPDPSVIPIYEDQYFRWKVTGHLENSPLRWEFFSSVRHELPFWNWIDQQKF